MEALTAFLSLMFATIEYEYNYEGLRAKEPNVPYASRALITITTMFTGTFNILPIVYFMIMRRYYKARWAASVRGDLAAQGDDRKIFKRPVLNLSAFVEFLIVIVQPLPFGDHVINMRAGYPELEYQFTLNELLYVMMFGKIYVILRYIISTSVYTNSDAKFFWYSSYLHWIVWSNMIFMQMLDMLSNA